MTTDRTIAQYVDAQGHMPSRVALAELTGLPEKACRALIREYLERNPAAPRHPKDNTGRAGVVETAYTAPAEPERPQIIGYESKMDTDEQEQEAYERAARAWTRTAAVKAMKAGQVVSFPRGPVALAFIGDQHFGNAGTDIERAFREAELIASTPGMYAVTCGDMLDQFIIGKLATVRFNAPTSIQDEWLLVRRYLRTLAPKLVASIAGNHDNWAQALTGVDLFREVLGQIQPHCLYDTDDSTFLWRVGQAEKIVRVRHAWNGSSIYNPTHAIERAAKWDQDFDIGVGAHTHTGGFCRESVAGGRHILAVQTGAYKRVDSFSRRIGFSAPNNSTAVAVVLTEQGEMVGFNSLTLCAEFMRRMASEAE